MQISGSVRKTNKNVLVVFHATAYESSIIIYMLTSFVLRRILILLLLTLSPKIRIMLRT